MTDNERVIRVQDNFAQQFPDAEASATELVLNIARAHIALEPLVSGTVRPYDIPSPTALVVLDILARADGPMTPTDVATRTFIGRATLSGVLDTLTRRGLVERTRDLSDRRSVLLTLTPIGRERILRALTELRRREVDWCAELTEDDRSRLIDLLGRIPADAD